MKNSLYYLLEPLDYISRYVNGKSHLPPIYLRTRTGPLRNFESVGGEFLAYMKLLCNLQPDSQILDLGCGCGNIALRLISYLNEKGSYRGADVDRKAIAWCQRHITAKHPSFLFDHINVYNRFYNPHGNILPGKQNLPYADGLFDLVIVKSVFTHILELETEHYISEIARLLARDGCCLATFFLFADEPPLEDSVSILFAHGSGDVRYRDKTIPEAVVAYRNSLILRLLEENGLRLRHPVFQGTWASNKAGLSHQDLLVIERKIKA